ncbi:MAG: hypothetical protein ABIH11_08425 [Candidatus Altiarchaeota archaeon]
MEHVLLTLMFMIFLACLNYSVIYDSHSMMETTTAEDAVDSIAKAADTVYSLGPCSKTYVDIVVPNSAVSSSVGDNRISLTIDTGAGYSDIVAVTIGDVTGCMPSNPGACRVPIEMTCSGVLVVGGVLSLRPSEIRFNVTDGGTTVVELNLTNNEDAIVSSIGWTVTGGVSSWTSITDMAAGLGSGISDQFNATFTIPSGTPTGTYSGTLTVNGTGGLAEVPIAINVMGSGTSTTTPGNR